MDPRSRDLAIRTILGEAAQEDDVGQNAVASVILNRLQSGRYGKSLPDVILARHQFEPWSTPAGRSRMMAYSPESQPYQRAAAAFDAAFAGNDPTNGATHFFSPSAQAALGRRVPQWAQGEGQPIGRHTFFAPEGRVNTAMAQQRPELPLPPGFKLMEDAPQPLPLPPGFNLIEDAPQPAPQAPPPQTPQPQQPQSSMLARAASPITNLPGTYQQMNAEAREQLGTGVEQLTGGTPAFDPVKDAYPPDSTAMRMAKGVGNVALGGIGYVASPINAGIRSIISKPIEDVTGIPKEYTDVAAGFMVPVPGANMARLKSAPIMTSRTLSAGEQVTQAGQNLGNVGASGAVNVPRAVASDSMSVQRAGAGVANVPIAGNPLVRAAGDTTKRLAEKSQEIAGEYGSASSITAGDTAATAIKDWIGPKSKTAVKAAYDKVDNLVNPSVMTDLSGTRTVAQAILDRRANANITDKSDAVRRVEEAVTNPQGLNYQGVKDLRTYMGEFLDGTRILPSDLRTSEVKQIYGGLTDDLRASVQNAGGPKALSAFERANTYAKAVADRRESLAKIVGANGDATSAQVFDRLVAMAGNTTRADMSKFAQARKAMGGDAWNEVASGVISQMGRTVDATGNVIFSPQRFLNIYTDKLSAPGRAMLFKSGGKENLAPFLDDIATISGRFKELQKFSNPSGTAQAGGFIASGWGLAIDPLTTIGLGVGTNVLARALATPATVAPVAQWTRKYALVVQAPNAANVAQLTIASRNLANTLNAEFGTSIAWQDLIKATQGSVKSRAEDENPKPEGVVNR
jgi:hypothetical protein